jgi:VanZ family protein
VKGKGFRVIHQGEWFDPDIKKGFRKDLWSRLWYWMPVWLFAGAITYVSSLSSPEQEFAGFLQVVNALVPTEGDIFSLISDKFYHVTEYAILGVLTYRAICSSWKQKLGASAGLLAVGCVVIFGCSDEIHQWFTPLRYSDGADLLADALGGILGVSLWEAVMSIPRFRLLDENFPMKLQLALGIPPFKL